ALVGEGARLGRSKTGDNQQRDDQRHEAGSSHEGTSRLMIEITNVTWDGNATARPPAGRPQCTNVANGTKQRSAHVRSGVAYGAQAEPFPATQRGRPGELWRASKKPRSGARGLVEDAHAELPPRIPRTRGFPGP